MTTEKSIVSGELFDIAYSMDNYLIEYDEYVSTGICGIYVSSSGIYYPNDEAIFKKKIVEQNVFEWYDTRFSQAEKHIFIRDIAKQFYITGLNNKIDTIDKIIEFLKNETKGYSVYIIGSSAGGYLAAILGKALESEIMLSFSGYFNLNIVDKDTWFFIDKFKEDPDRKKYYNTVDFIKNCGGVTIYIYPQLLEGDVEQSKLIEKKDITHKIGFRSKIHGVPFSAIALKKIMSMKSYNIDRLFDQIEKRNINSAYSLDLYLFGRIHGTYYLINRFLGKYSRKVKTLIRRLTKSM